MKTNLRNHGLGWAILGILLTVPNINASSDFQEVPGQLRLSADFHEPDSQTESVPRLDQGAGEQRLSRLWRVGDYQRVPWDSRGSRSALNEALFYDSEKGWAFQPRVDVAVNAMGNLNPRSGTMAFWLKPDQLREQGGLLFTGKTFMAGGARGGIDWALGVGGARDSHVPPGKLFLSAGMVQLIADEPLPDRGWVHVAAVWDADSGAKLYLDGEEIGSVWGPVEEADDVVEEVFYPVSTFLDSLQDWRISSGLGSGRPASRIFDSPPTDEVKLTWLPDGGLEVQSSHEERLQLRSHSVGPLDPGDYLMVMEYSQEFTDDLEESPRGLNMRISVDQPGDPEGWSESFNTPSVSTPEIQTATQILRLEAEEGERFRLIFDINIWTPGRTVIQSLRVLRAHPALLERMDTADVVAGRGTYFARSLRNIHPVPVNRIHWHQNRAAGGFTGLRIFDLPLNSDEIAALAAGEELPEALEGEELLPDPERRAAELFWGEDLDGDLIFARAGRPVTIREEWAERVYEDLRLAGWLAVDGYSATLSPWPYHGYRHVEPRKLHLEFPGPIQANYLMTRGTMTGVLRDGGSRDDPLGGNDFLELPGAPHVFRTVLPQDLQTETATVLRSEGQLSGIHFYHIDNRAPEIPEGSLILHLWGGDQGDLPLSERKQWEFTSSYSAADRRFLVGHREARGAALTGIVKPWRAHHLFSPSMREDYPLQGIGLRLFLRPTDTAVTQTRLQVRLHDSFAPWRELGRFDFEVQPDEAREPVDLFFELRETLIPEGHAVWVTLIAEHELELLSWPGEAESALILLKADEQAASRNWLERELADWRNSFEDTSEPRPWNRGITDDPESGWWLKAASPDYERMWLTGEALSQRFPEDRRVESWLAFIRPSIPNPSRDIEPPRPEGDQPEWAVLARANLLLYKEFVEYWTRERAHPIGELGNWIGDDTCLLQDWPDLALINDPDGRYHEVVRKLADGVVNRFINRGRFFLENGLNSRWTDALHAYEDGLNMQPMAFQLDYGNPLLLYRLFETASRYDGFLLTNERDGMRRFNSEGRGIPYWSTDRQAEGNPEDRSWFLVTHAGQILLWFNRQPRVLQEFEELGESVLELHRTGREPQLGRGGFDFLVSLYASTGEEKWLDPLIDWTATRNSGILTVQTGSYYDPSFLALLDDDAFDHAKTAQALREDADTRYNDIGTRHLGFGDRRYERNWLEWKLTGNKEYLNEGLRELYRRLTFSMPAVTVAEQSGDRVSIPKQIISQMYLGGVPVARNNQFYPLYAVSYENLGTDFAALVFEDRTDKLRILFYNFAGEPLEGLLRVWRLDPGQYEITTGTDRTGDHRIDWAGSTQTLELVRGDGVDLELPPGQVVVWEANLKEESTPLHERPDLAVTHEDARWHSDGSLTVRVHNIGGVDSPESEVVLLNAAGEVAARRSVPALEAPLDLQPRYTEITFGGGDVGRVARRGEPVRVMVDPEASLEEITRRNNETIIPGTTGE